MRSSAASDIALNWKISSLFLCVQHLLCCLIAWWLSGGFIALVGLYRYVMRLVSVNDSNVRGLELCSVPAERRYQGIRLKNATLISVRQFIATKVRSRFSWPRRSCSERITPAWKEFSSVYDVPFIPGVRGLASEFRA